MPISGSQEFIEKLLNCDFLDYAGQVSVMEGHEVDGYSLSSIGFWKPILVPVKNGLRLKVPPANFSPVDLLNHIDPKLIVDVIDVRAQMELQMSLQEFVDAFTSDDRKTLLNMLSLEFSHTKFSKFVDPPHVVSEMSLISNCWIDENSDECVEFSETPSSTPCVQKYCLLSMAGSYTDFHIDFGGSSVWYHILWGEKVFFLVPPTQIHRSTYWKWFSDPDHRQKFFPDQLSHITGIGKEVYRLHLFPGQTILLPSGWIHAVYTVSDCMVFGGNFLSELHIPMQISVYRMELKLQTPSKFQFPYFEKIHWFAAERLVGHLTNILHDDRKAKPYEINAARCLAKTLPRWFNKRQLLPLSERYYFIPRRSTMELSCMDLVRRLQQIVQSITTDTCKQRTAIGDTSPYTSTELELASYSATTTSQQSVAGLVRNRMSRAKSQTVQKQTEYDRELLEVLPELEKSRLIGDHYFLTLSNSDESEQEAGNELHNISKRTNSDRRLLAASRSRRRVKDNDPTWSIQSSCSRKSHISSSRSKISTHALLTDIQKGNSSTVYVSGRDLHPLLPRSSNNREVSMSSSLIHSPSSSSTVPVGSHLSGARKARQSTKPITARQRLAKRLGI